MSVNVETSISGPYAPNGVTTGFSFDFKAASASEIQVIQVLGGVQSVVPNADYDVLLNAGGGGTIIFTVAPLAGSGALYIVSSPDFTRSADFSGRTPFDVGSVNNELDRALVRDIALRGDVDRAIKVPVGTTAPEYADLTATFKGDPGGSPQAIGLFATAATHLSGAGFIIPTGIDVVATDGYSVLDRGGALYVYDSSVDAAYVTANPKTSFLSVASGSDPSRGFRIAEDQDIGPEMLAAAGNGGTDDSAAYSGAVALNQQVSPSAGKSYALKDISLSNLQGINGSGQNFTAAAGATNAFVLNDFNPRLTGLYFSGATNASEALVRIKASRFAALKGIIAVNCGPGFVRLVPVTPASDIIALANISDCDAEDVTGIGVELGSSVSETRSANLHLFGKQVPGTGGALRSMFTSIGLRANTPVIGGIAVGGHQFVNLNTIGFNRGIHLTDAQLWKFANGFADGCADYAILLDGACDNLTFSDQYVGTSRGIKVMGTCQHIHFDGLETTANGTIPPGGPADYFNGVSTFYDLEVRDTARVRVSNWKGDKRIAVDATARLIVADGDTLHGRSTTTVAANSTVYLMESGAQASESAAMWRAPYDCYIIRLMPSCDVAPGAGQSFTYTARKTSGDTPLTAAISGAGVFGGADSWAGTMVSANKGDSIAIKLVTSATAAAAIHQVQLQLVPR